jgi:hypothetical protein
MKSQLILKHPDHIFRREVQVDLDCGQAVIAKKRDEGRPLHPANRSLITGGCHSRKMQDVRAERGERVRLAILQIHILILKGKI